MFFLLVEMICRNSAKSIRKNLIVKFEINFDSMSNWTLDGRLKFSVDLSRQKKQMIGSRYNISETKNNTTKFLMSTYFVLTKKMLTLFNFKYIISSFCEFS